MKISDLETLADVMAQNAFIHRRLGRTESLCELAKTHDGLVITFSEVEAKRLKKTYGVDAASYANPEKLRGGNKPFFVDQEALVRIMQEALPTVRQVSKALLELDDAARDLSRRIACLSSTCEVRP